MMNNEELRKVIKRAQYVANKWGYSSDAEDFAQEAALAVATRGPQKIEWLLIDYLRREYGNSRSRISRIRLLANRFAVRLDAPISDEDGSGELNHAVIGDLKTNPEYIATNRRARIPYERLYGQELVVAIMYFEEERKQNDIASYLGISESRVCKILRSCRQKLKTYTEYEKLKEETFLADNFMKIRLK